MRSTGPPASSLSTRFRRARTSLLVGVIVVALFSFAYFGMSKPTQAGNRLKSGPAPAFAATDVVSGRVLTAANVFGQKNTLLFFSEGVMCQACLEQITSLEKISGQLVERDLALVSITPDSPEELRDAARDYKIRTPLLSDEGRRMSTDYDVLGLGMHPDMPGHTFILVDREGTIRWRRDYTTMYVEPEKLLAEIPEI